MTERRNDFRGGYATELAPEQMDENMVLLGRNLYYKGSLKKRPGWTNLSTDATIHGYTVRGFVRAYINSGWYNVVAVDDATYVNFYYGNAGAYTAITATYNWTKDKNVEMVFFNDCVIAVNGTDDPAIIYYDSAWIAEDLQAYDARERGDDEWYAGQWDDSGATPDLQFIDDTDDAQSSTADDFSIATVTNDDGFYVAGVTVFNKIVITNCPDLGAVTATYKYYAGSGVWTAVSMVTTPDWNAAEGDKTIEFDVPLASDGSLAWEKYGDVDTQKDPTDVPGGTLNRYIFRVQFTTAVDAGSADTLAVSHTQYLKQIFLDDKPTAVTVHKDRVFLFTTNAFRFSPPNQVTEWNSRDIEYVDEGGEKVVCAVSADEYLAIFKEAGLYRYIGTTTANFVLRFTPMPGAVSPRGAANVSGALFYVAEDGIRLYVNGKSVVLTRHLQGVFDAFTKTDAVLVDWAGSLVVSFPTDTKIFWADPDTIRQDDMGDGRLSFWDWIGLAADGFVYASGSGDNGYLIGYDSVNSRFTRETTNGYDIAFDTTETAITTTLQTKYDSFASPGTRKTYKRQKIETSKSGAWTLTFYANDGSLSKAATIASGSGTGHNVKEASPLRLDGYNLSTKLVNATNNAVAVYGFSTEFERRAF